MNSGVVVSECALGGNSTEISVLVTAGIGILYALLSLKNVIVPRAFIADKSENIELSRL